MRMESADSAPRRGQMPPAYRTSSATPLTFCTTVQLSGPSWVSRFQTHHSRPRFTSATWQTGAARRSRRGTSAPGWKTFSKKTRSELAGPARSNPKPRQRLRCSRRPAGCDKQDYAWPNPPAPRIGKALHLRIPEKESSEVPAGQEGGPGLITGKASVAQEQLSTCE